MPWNEDEVGRRVGEGQFVNQVEVVVRKETRVLSSLKEKGFLTTMNCHQDAIVVEYKRLHRHSFFSHCFSFALGAIAYLSVGKRNARGY